MSEQKRLEAIVHGMVQGVGFRWWTRQIAQRLGLSGYVRNRYDHTVEVVAEGPERRLRKLLSLLQVGPSSSVVERVDIKWAPISGKYRGFEVRF